MTVEEAKASVGSRVVVVAKRPDCNNPLEEIFPWGCLKDEILGKTGTLTAVFDMETDDGIEFCAAHVAICDMTWYVLPEWISLVNSSNPDVLLKKQRDDGLASIFGQS